MREPRNRVVQVRRFGGPEGLEVVDAPLPTAGRGDAAGLHGDAEKGARSDQPRERGIEAFANTIDGRPRAGRTKGALTNTLPKTLEAPKNSRRKSRSNQAERK